MKTKELLADSFRSLVLTMPFQKISIKMITDGAHVIRPTFYNYFQDKYEVIEFLFDQDIGSKVRSHDRKRYGTGSHQADVYLF